MNVGDAVVDIRSVGTIVGVSSTGNPVVEWAGELFSTFEEFKSEDLIVVELPKPVDELNPRSEKEEEAYQQKLLDKKKAKTEKFSKLVEETIEKRRSESE